MTLRPLPVRQAGAGRQGAAFALAAVFLTAPLGAADEVSLGLVAPLTGDQAYIGVGMMQGVQIAIEDANVQGPVFGASKLRLIALDDQHNPTQAVLAANKLVSDPSVLGVVGHFNSSCTKAASSIYYEARLAQVSPASTNPDISKQGFDTFFRVCATDDVQGPAAADFMKNELKIDRVAIIDDQTTYGKGLADQFEKTFKALGGTVIRRDGITQGEKDYMPLLTRIRAVNPPAVFFGGVYPELALLLRQSRKVGLKSLWMGGDAIYNAVLVELAGDAAEGVYATMLGVDPHALPEARDFVTRYEARYGEIGAFSAYGYDAANVIIAAMRRAGKADREAVLAEVRKTKDFPGILGPVNFDERGDAVGKSLGVFKVEDGKFKFLKEVKPA